MSRGTTLVAGALPISPLPMPSGVLRERTGWMRTALGLAEDVLLAIGLVACIPLVILAVGIPIALLMRLLLWIAGGA